MHAIKPYVLVVDDVPDTAASMADLLTCWGYDADPCYGGRSALAAARSRRPAAVLLDLAMAPMDGFGFAARFRRMPGCGRTPVVVVSGHTAPRFSVRGRAYGIGHYLIKPADPAVVLALLQRLIPDSGRQGPGTGHPPAIRSSAHLARREGPCFDSPPLCSSSP